MPDDNTLVLLEIFVITSCPFSWAEDGSLSIGWYPDEGMVTLGISGDDLVIYNAFFEDTRQFEGICELSDTPVLSGFLTTLTNIL